MKEIILPSYRWDEEEDVDWHNPQVIIRNMREKFTAESEEVSIINPDLFYEKILELQQKIERKQHTIAKKSLYTKTITKGELVYNKLQRQLEKKYMGKVVAIDVDNKEMIGIGNSIEEAHDDAISKSQKKRFYFKKVGQKHSSSI